MQPVSNRPRLLVVDDNIDTAMVLGELLGGDGYDAEILRDGLAAIARLEHGLDFDALITDFHLPGASGIEICQRAAARAVAIPMFVLTGDPVAAQLASDALGLRIVILAKPIEYPELVARLAAVLRGQAVVI